jgi:hypothetical protein
MKVLQIDEMGPASGEVTAFIKAVFKPARVKEVKCDRYKTSDVMVCGDWRVFNGAHSEPGGDVLARMLDAGEAPATLIYALLGSTELKRALTRNPADGWRRVIKAGGRVIVLQVDRISSWKKNPFTVEQAREALPTIAPKSAVLWHQPAKPLSL